MSTITSNGQNGRVVHVEQASLKTATITVKALTIDKRQMTLSVFRQLQEEALVDTDTGEFRGLPWGTVNYCPDKKTCGYRPRKHLHVIWQKGDELRRATEKEPQSCFAPGSGWSGSWATIAATDRGYSHLDWELSHGAYFCLVRFVDGLPPLYCYLPDGLNPADAIDRPDCNCGGTADDSDPHQYFCAVKPWLRWRTALTKAVDVAVSKGFESLDDLTKEISRDVEEQHAVHTARQNRWQELLALDQLFIAT